MVENYQNTLNEKDANAIAPAATRPLPEVPSQAGDLEAQILQDAAMAEMLAATEKRQAEEWAAEREARLKEQEVVNEKLQQILRTLENAPQPSGQSPGARDHEESSDDDKEILNMVFQHAAGKRAERESMRKDIDINALLSGRMGGLNLNEPGSSGAPGRGPNRGRVRMTNRNSGNINRNIVYGSHNDNSTVTQIHKGESRVFLSGHVD